MSSEHDEKETTLENALRALSKVTPNLRVKKNKDRLIFIALVIGSAFIFITSMLPHKNQKALAGDRETTQGADTTLSQNLKALAEMRNEKKAAHLGYRGARDANHPPNLRAHEVKALKKETKSIDPEILARMNAPTSFSEGGFEANNGSSPNGAGSHPVLIQNNANAEFMNAQDDIVTVTAKRIPHPDFTIPADEMIPATLEVAMNSELPGLIRAVVTQDIYSLTGNNLLIPKGSSLNGQFNSSVIQGQSRFLVVWNRVRRPDGVIVTLSSPGTDKIGRSGQGADYIDRHFLERFGTSVLLSILSGVTATSGVNSQDQYNSAAQYRTTIAASLQQSSSQALEQDLAIKPTLSANQGKEINVFVAKDLDFSSVGVFREALPIRKPGFMSRLWK